jgi:hypothetical protein
MRRNQAYFHSAPREELSVCGQTGTARQNRLEAPIEVFCTFHRLDLGLFDFWQFIVWHVFAL